MKGLLDTTGRARPVTSSFIIGIALLKLGIILAFDWQLEANKRREVELQKLRRDLEEAHAHTEAQTASMRKKQQDAINELTEQLDQLQKLKQKWVKFIDVTVSTKIHRSHPMTAIIYS